MKVLLIASLFTLASCGGDSGGGSGVTTTTSSAPVEVQIPEDDSTVETKSLRIIKKRKVELKKDFSNLDEFKLYINSYIIQFEAKSGSYQDASVICTKTNFDQTKGKFYGSFDQRGQIASVDLDILDTDPSVVSYDCEVRDFDKDLVIEKEPVYLTKSYIVSGAKNFQAIINAKDIQTLLLDKGSELSTKGLGLDINVKELFSNDGKIVTFPSEETKATKVNRPGLPGGNMDLKIKSGFGKVTFEMRGLDAGKQENLRPKMTKIPAANVKLNGACNTQLGRDPELNDKSCIGKQGDRGFQGEQGFTGLNGGDSGTLNLIVSGEHHLKIQLLFFPGASGEGGIGGEGGPGGPGGIGATVYYSSLPDSRGCQRCSSESSNYQYKFKYPDGPQGLTGPRGEKGLSGESGKNNLARLIFSHDNTAYEVNSNWEN